jgi:hypothetical protein
MSKQEKLQGEVEVPEVEEGLVGEGEVEVEGVVA